MGQDLNWFWDAPPSPRRCGGRGGWRPASVACGRPSPHRGQSRRSRGGENAADSDRAAGGSWLLSLYPPHPGSSTSRRASERAESLARLACRKAGLRDPVPIATPLRQERGVQPLSPKNDSDLAGLLGPIHFAQDPQLVFRGEPTPRRRQKLECPLGARPPAWRPSSQTEHSVSDRLVSARSQPSRGVRGGVAFALFVHGRLGFSEEPPAAACVQISPILRERLHSGSASLPAHYNAHLDPRPYNNPRNAPSTGPSRLTISLLMASIPTT